VVRRAYISAKMQSQFTPTAHLAIRHFFKQQSTTIAWWVYIILAIPLIELLTGHQDH
jgi:hypothetical protein